MAKQSFGPIVEDVLVDRLVVVGLPFEVQGLVEEGPFSEVGEEWN